GLLISGRSPVLSFRLCVLRSLKIAFFFSSRRRHTSFSRDWSSDVCSSDLPLPFRFLPWLFSAAALTALYMLVPNCRVPWRNALLAGMLIALLFEAGKFLFSRIIGMFPSYQLIYGAFAAVPLFLLWIYRSEERRV